MMAFGMSEGGQQQDGNANVGATSVAANAAVTNVNNGVTIVTPYGKY